MPSVICRKIYRQGESREGYLDEDVVSGNFPEKEGNILLIGEILRIVIPEDWELRGSHGCSPGPIKTTVDDVRTFEAPTPLPFSAILSPSIGGPRPTSSIPDERVFRIVG